MKIKYSYRLKKIAKIANSRKGKVLDIGYSLLPNPFLRGYIIGVDIFIPKKRPKNYKKLIKADVTKKLPFKKDSIDVIVLSGVIEHLENPLKALREMNRVLKKGGILLMETPNPYFIPVILSDLIMNLRYYFEDTHINLFPRRIILKMLWHTGFDLKDIKGCGFNLTERFTIPLPQQLSQDVIYVAVKRTPKHRLFKKVRRLRKDNYEELE
jgi:SAM-dependent methyltransferase